MQAWCKFRKSVSGNLYFCTDAINLTDISEVNVFIEAIKSLNPVLVVYDTLARCSTGMAENDTGDMGVFVEHADLVRRATGATQLFVHHSGKSGQEERGSSALRAACCMMQRVIYDDGIIRLSCDKSRISAGFDDRKFRLVAVPDTDGVIPLPAAMVKDDGKLTDLQQATVEYLARDINADIFISQTDIADAIGKGKGSVNKMLNKLIRMQLAEKNGSGKVRITTAGLRVAQELEQDEAPEASQTIDTSGYNWQVSRREND
jgi:DNA-binding MarR family transcriptional regulator